MKHLKKLCIALTVLVTSLLTSCSSEDDQADVVTKEEQVALDSFSDTETEVKLDDSSDYTIRLGGNAIKAVIFSGPNYTGRKQEIRIPRSRAGYIWANFDAKSIQVAPGCRARIRWWREGNAPYNFDTGPRHSYMTTHSNLQNQVGRAFWLNCNDNKRVLKGVVTAGPSSLYLFKDNIDLGGGGAHLRNIFNDKNLDFHPINNWDHHSYVMFHKNNYPSSQVVHALPNGRYHWRANNNHRRIPGWKGASYITVRNIDWRQGEHLGNTQYHKAPKWKKDLVRRFYFYGHGRKKSCTERHYRNLKGVGVVGTVCAVGCIALNAADGEALLAPCLYACGKVAGGAAVVNAYSKIINCR